MAEELKAAHRCGKHTQLCCLHLWESRSSRLVEERLPGRKTIGLLAKSASLRQLCLSWPINSLGSPLLAELAGMTHCLPLESSSWLHTATDVKATQAPLTYSTWHSPSPTPRRLLIFNLIVPELCWSVSPVLGFSSRHLFSFSHDCAKGHILMAGIRTPG